MHKKIAICPGCHTKIQCEGESGKKVKVECLKCGRTGSIIFKSELKELDFYPLNEPYAYAKILKNIDTLEKHYKVIEPYLNEEEQKNLNFIWETLLKTFNLRLDELDDKKIEHYLIDQVEQVIKSYELDIDDLSKRKILYYIKRESLGFGKIDPLMKDPHIEDVSCDGVGTPIFLYHRKYGSVRSNVEFKDEDELSYFVIRLAQKCGKHISIAEPMLDATMPDGSRIQMTLSNEVTTRGSTFTIRKFRADPFTPPDLVALNTLSSEILAYFWMAVENRVNALIAGGTASGKTTILNALSLFIPREAKIVSIEETRELNLPHPNWIPGVSRSGFGEVVANRMVGEIDMYDLMKAALRQRPEYIIVGEIRGKEAYVLFQAMATGHATYSTVHADSAKSLIHRLEGKPIEIPRIMLQSLDIVSIHITTRVKGKRVRRCKQIIEIIDIDPTTKEILTNEVFRWDPIEDRFIYTGKSYILEGIRARWSMSKEDITREIRDRAEILEWMNENEVRTYKEVAKAISRYTENPEDFLKKMRNPDLQKKKDDKKEEKSSKKKSKLSTKKEKAEKELNEMLTVHGKDQDWDQDESDSISENKIVALSDLECIDVKTAALLQDNGIDSIEDLKNASVKDLNKIEGIDKKLAKKIKKEVEKNIKGKPKELEKEEKEEPEPEKDASHKIKAFEGIKSIDDEAAVLLYNNGSISIEDLKDVSVKALTKIKGINKKTAKKIIKELEDIAGGESSQDSDEGGERDAAE
ncbi:MAG: Flp pilus assembly complex ATPase component TadA [Thermoplasmatales archaeon]|nr:Flp pilus assembly complex ATPase component TadA [Thermoplasmatales archaeon]